MTYQIGQIIPLDAKRSMWAEPIPPTWFIIRARSQSEVKLMAWLAKNGAPDTWRPMDEIWVPDPTGKRKLVKAERAVAPGYIFANLTRVPQWDIFKERARGKFLGVICNNGEPMPISEADLMKMRQAPAIIEAKRERERQARTIHPGDKADIIGGAMDGWRIDVSRLDRGIAYFVVPMLGAERELSAPEETLRKVVAT